MKTSTKETIQETVKLTLPREIVEDLNKIALFEDTNVENLIYSYIVDGLASNSRTVNRMKFTDKANNVLSKNNIPPKTVEDIFNSLVY